LGLRGTKIRNFRIEVAAHLGLAAAVAAVANGASVGEILVGLFQNIGRGLPGVGCVASTAGDGNVTDRARYGFFDRRRLGISAEATANDDDAVRSHEDEDDADEQCCDKYLLHAWIRQ